MLKRLTLVFSLFLTVFMVVSLVGCSDDENPTNSGNSDSTDTVTDFDGNVYKTIKIGDQLWMAENLKVTHYRNGDAIPNWIDSSTWGDLAAGAYCDFDNDTSNVAVYGRLYNWFAVDDSRKIAPEGWRVPTDADWKELEMHLGMTKAEADGDGYSSWRGSDEGGKLKEAGLVHWRNPNVGATDESHFTALPAGCRRGFGDFVNFHSLAFFWQSTEDDRYNAWTRSLHYYYSTIKRERLSKTSGFSVRCIKD